MAGKFHPTARKSPIQKDYWHTPSAIVRNLTGHYCVPADFGGQGEYTAYLVRHDNGAAVYTGEGDEANWIEWNKATFGVYFRHDSRWCAECQKRRKDG